MGLYGNVLVEPADPDYWPPVHREVLLTLDDILLEDGKVAPFSRTETTYAAMGRFGNVLLVGGETDLSLSAQLGEVVRLYLTNTANTRVFKVALPGARMKLVGGDSGHVEHEQFVEDVVLAPSERVGGRRAVRPAGRADARAPDAGAGLSAGRDQRRRGSRPSRRSSEQFEVLRTNADMVAERERIARVPGGRARQDARVHRRDGHGGAGGDGPVVYACPMHPEVVSEEPGHCPECGMKLLAVEAPAATYTCPMHPEVVSDQPGHCPECGMKLLPSSLSAEAGGGHEHEGHEHARTRPTTTRRPAGSSGKTTWSRSTG